MVNGRLSDRLGRKPLLIIGYIASVLSYAITIQGKSSTHLWLAMIPTALFSQSYTVLKALFADYQSDLAATESQRAAALGRLGMSVGIAFMLGPVLGASIFTSYIKANQAALVLTIFSGLVVLQLPDSDIEIARKSSNNLADMTSSDKNKQPASIFNLDFLSLPVVNTSGARLLFLIRLGMGMAFHILMIVWPVSLKRRFEFGPSQHAYLMGWTGLCYSVSQGVVAQYLIKLAGEDATNVLITCMIVLGWGRIVAVYSTSLVVVYIVVAFVIMALGVVNTTISSACSSLAGKDQVGGLFGVMESVESIAELWALP